MQLHKNHTREVDRRRFDRTTTSAIDEAIKHWGFMRRASEEDGQSVSIMSNNRHFVKLPCESAWLDTILVALLDMQSTSWLNMC
jgi:hypothetical protein